MNSSPQALDRPRKKAENIGLKASSTTGSPDEAALDLAAIWHTVSRNKWLILLTCTLITAAAVGYTWTLPETYQATSIVSVEMAPSAATQVLRFGGGAPELATEIGILENSGQLSRRVVERMHEIADTTANVRFTLFEADDDEAPVGPYEASTRLSGMMQFKGSSERGMIGITALSESPKEAALLANVFAEEYRLFSQEMARSGVVAAREFLEDQLEKRKADIQAVEQEWETFAHSNAVVTQGQDGQNVAREYVELQTQRDAIEFQLEAERRTLAILNDQLEKIQPSLRNSVLEEQEAVTLRTQIQAIENQIATLMTQAEQYYINDPSLRGNESRIPELADIRRRIDGFESRRQELTDQLVEATTENSPVLGDGSTSLGQLATLRDRIKEQELKIDQMEAQGRVIDGRIAAYQGRIETIPRQTIQREQIDRRLTQAEQFYKDIAMELQRTVIAEESELGYVQVMRAAVIPSTPVSPDLIQNTVLGALLGLALGLGTAFVRQSMNWQIYAPEDIQAQGYSLVGVIPKMDREIKKAFQGEETVEVEGKRLSTHLIPLLNPWSPITENYRLIRANLQFNALNGEEAVSPQVIMITSPEPGDGKTTTAVNLAITIALSGRKVLLIDADMRRPRGHHLLGVGKSPGLAEILSADAREVDTTQHTLIDGLYFMPAGTSSLPPTELLDSARMRKILTIGRERFDVIIIDTPPVLAASDPLVIATQCDAVLIVASADKTDFRALEQVKSTLGAVGVPIGGVIFNNYDVEKANGTYKYGYGYGSKYDYSPTA